MGNKHWQSFGELNQTDAFEENGKNEFSEELPLYTDHKDLLNAKAPREIS